LNERKIMLIICARRLVVDNGEHQHQSQLEHQEWELLQQRDPACQKWLDDFNKAGEKMMDMTQYSQSDSKDLKAAEFIGKNLKVIISGVEIRDYPAQDGKPANSKPVLSFEGKDKQLVLNATNTKVLCTAYGNDDEGWKNHEIGLTVADYTDKGFGHGWIVTPLDVAAPDFDDDIPF